MFQSCSLYVFTSWLNNWTSAWLQGFVCTTPLLFFIVVSSSLVYIGGVTYDVQSSLYAHTQETKESCRARSCVSSAPSRAAAAWYGSDKVDCIGDGISRRRPADCLWRLVSGLWAGPQVFLCQLLLRSPFHGPQRHTVPNRTHCPGGDPSSPNSSRRKHRRRCSGASALQQPGQRGPQPCRDGAGPPHRLWRIRCCLVRKHH